MPDTPGDSSTTATITVGGTYNDTLEFLGDHDWIRITLTAGQSITVFVDGLTLEDSYLRVRNSAGTVLYENDDINLGVNRDSQLSFTATTSGTYYIDVGSFDESYTGTYQVSVTTYAPPPLATYDQIANQLVEGYWAGDDHHFDVGQGGSISVNITALTAPGQDLARAALQLWSDVIGVTFVEVTSGGQITFDDNQSGAFSDGSWSNGIITSSHVNVSTEWIAQYGTGTNSYSFQTYVHEIGHALGLGHAGNYNGSAQYPYDASFQNDAWVTSIMSYFSPTENTYFAGQGFTENFVVTPMLADIVAMDTLYGLSTTTRTGNTTYGFNSTAGRAVYDASVNPGVAYSIFDSGGTDTLDYSGFGSNQLINLNPETFSNVGPGVGNVSIGRGVVIENAIGGGGNDTIYGNAANNVLTGNGGNDILNGGAGADVMIGGLGDDRFVIDNSGDQVVELAGQGDDWALAGTSYALGAGAAVEILSTANGDGTQATSLTGNGFSQSIYGNAGSNILTGGGGADYLAGGPGDDRYFVDQDDIVAEAASQGDDWALASSSFELRSGAAVEILSTVNGDGTQAINLTGNGFSQSIYGNAGSNILTGGGGADYLAGGPGDDRYFVDQDDVVAEAAGQGDDWALASSSFELRSGASIETLSTVNGDGTQAINLTGNELAQSIYGNAGANILSGGGGADRLIGGLGNDRYFVDQDDVVAEAAGQGDDWALASTSFALGAGVSIETLSTVNGDGTQAINLSGNELAQSIYGNAGANILSGGGGADSLIGGLGNDTFVISSLPGVATVADYGAGDVVDISQLLNVAGGTDVVTGGYVRVTAGGQLEVDANGGGDAYVALANVSGSSPVTIRYLAGGVATDLTVSRSASQSMAMAAAAAGIAVKLSADGGSMDAASATSAAIIDPVQHTQALTPIALDDAGALQASVLTPLASALSAAYPAEAVAFHAPAEPISPALFDAAPVLTASPVTLIAATDAPAFATTALAAPSLAMPAAAQLAAATGSEGVQHSQIVEQVLADALGGKAAHGPDIDTLLAGLASHNGAPLAGIEQLATLPGGHAFAASAAPLGEAFAVDAVVMHHDAPPAA